MTKLQQALAKAKAEYEAKGYTIKLDAMLFLYNKEYIGLLNVEKGQYRISISYHANGNMWSINRSKNGKLHGVFKLYLYDGTLVSYVGYKKGKLHGYHKIFHESGKLVECIKYDNDQQID